MSPVDRVSLQRSGRPLGPSRPKTIQKVDRFTITLPSGTWIRLGGQFDPRSEANRQLVLLQPAGILW